jgi:hypothetical protein
MTLAFEPAGEIKLEQGDLHVLHAEARGARNRVYRNRSRSKRRQYGIHAVLGGRAR